MFIVDDITGNITLRQGDNGEYTLFGIPTDMVYVGSLAVVDENRNRIGEEIITNTNQTEGSVTFTFTPEFTDKLTVKRGEESATYDFAVKLRVGVNYIEDTLVIGNKTIYDKNTITVLPKIAEG